MGWEADRCWSGRRRVPGSILGMTESDLLPYFLDFFEEFGRCLGHIFGDFSNMFGTLFGDFSDMFGNGLGTFWEHLG